MELFSFVEVTLIQYATVVHFPGVAASSVKPKLKKANKLEIVSDEPVKGETQVNATSPTTPRPKPKDRLKATLRIVLLRERANHRMPEREAKVVARVSVESLRLE